MPNIRIAVVPGDALTTETDVLLLKHARFSHGLDREVVRRLSAGGRDISNELPETGKFLLLDSFKAVAAKAVLFVGVPQLIELGYGEIREFGALSLSILKKEAPASKSILQTVHGPGYGLDEIEAFRSQIAGITESIKANNCPPQLEQIIFIEFSKNRAKNLSAALAELFPSGIISTAPHGESDIEMHSQKILSLAGYNSENKKKAFVAMPFAQEFSDIYDYGITGAVRAAGYLCERADMQSYTGDVMQWVKNRIRTADFVIADLTTANPNVYLEVGYAWGLLKPTILLVKDQTHLKFDTKGERCLLYDTIKELETRLRSELISLQL